MQSLLNIFFFPWYVVEIVGSIVIWGLIIYAIVEGVRSLLDR